MLNFITEASKNFEETQTIGSCKEGDNKNSFEAMYENAYNILME